MPSRWNAMEALAVERVVAEQVETELARASRQHKGPEHWNPSTRVRVRWRAVAHTAVAVAPRLSWTCVRLCTAYRCVACHSALARGKLAALVCRLGRQCSMRGSACAATSAPCSHTHNEPVRQRARQLMIRYSY